MFPKYYSKVSGFFLLLCINFMSKLLISMKTTLGTSMRVALSLQVFCVKLSSL